MIETTRRDFLAAGGGTIGAAVAGCLESESADDTAEWDTGEALSVTTAKQYQGPGCDCCDVYAGYLEDHLESDLDAVVTDDLAAVKAEYGIDSSLRSCHTVEIEGYVVEGHVPVEVIAQLLEEGPAIDGIALPGMPSGSPGMGGEKTETWTMYEIASGDVYAER